MSLRRVASFNRSKAPPLTCVMRPELIQLRKLPPLARCLFDELRALATPDGHVVATYAVLIAVLDWDGAREADRPTLQKVRTALQSLVDLGLVHEMDRRRNRRDKRLFFTLAKVQGPSSASDSSNRRSSRPELARKQATARVSGGQPMAIQQTLQQGLVDPEIHRERPVDKSKEVVIAEFRELLSRKRHLLKK
jgi:hypothetical protein